MVHIGNSWDERLKDEFNSEYYQKLREFLKNEYRTKTVYPDMYDISDDISLNTDIHSNMWTTDDSDIDYDDDQLFMVFSYPEVLNMANALLWASNECKGEFNMDISFLGDKIIQEED